MSKAFPISLTNNKKVTNQQGNVHEEGHDEKDYTKVQQSANDDLLVGVSSYHLPRSTALTNVAGITVGMVLVAFCLVTLNRTSPSSLRNLISAQSIMGTTHDGFLVTSSGDDISVMARKPIFPVFAGMDLDRTLRHLELKDGTGASDGDASGIQSTTLFGYPISYSALATVDEPDIANFFKHIAATGDGNAECKTDMDGFKWSYDINFPVNGHDTNSNVYFGTGYKTQSIPYVDSPVIIVDCSSKSGVCIAGEAESSVLPWGILGETSDRRQLQKNGPDDILMVDYNEMRTRKLFSSFRRRRTEAVSLWEKLDEVAECWTTEYDLIIYSQGHTVVAAMPNDMNSDCPIIAVDARNMEEENNGPKKLTKTAMIVDKDDLPEYNTFNLHKKLTLRKFYMAVNAARTTEAADREFDIVSNSCALFVLDVLGYLEIPYKEGEMKNDIIQYVSQALMKNDLTKNEIMDTLSRKEGMAAGVWRKLRSDKAVMEHIVESFIDNHHYNN